MRVTQSDLAAIVAKASFLWERLHHPLFQIDTTSITLQQINGDRRASLAENRLNRWCQVTAQGNWQKFQKRLQWDGLDMQTIIPLLTEIPNLTSETLPSWAETLKVIIETAANIEAKKLENFEQLPNPIDSKNPFPYQDVFLPLVLVARHKLITYLNLHSSSLKLLSETAYQNIERQLLEKLLNISAKTLELEFSHFRPLGHSLLTLLIGENLKEKSKVHYNNFVQQLLEDGLLAFFHKYAVLARLMATTIDFWVEATGEFIIRLQADLSEIQQVFAQANQLGKIININASMSDSHHQGRSVILITFESGIKLVYKPKNLGLEIAYTQFLTWYNQQNIPLPLKVLKILNRETYGWVEYVEQKPCKDEDAAKRFYQRAGILLCLLYILRGTDCHYENLIANGEHLVLIDMETLLHHNANPMTDSFAPTASQISINEHLWDSVLQTGLLPRWELNNDNSIVYDISGLGSVSPAQSIRRIPQWQSINTDNMCLGYIKVNAPLQGNEPILNGVCLSPNNYLEDLILGFKQMYLFLIDKQSLLLANDSPLKVFESQSIRFVFRPTQVYSVILKKTLTPEYLQNGIERSIELDILSRAFIISPEKPAAWSIFQSENQQMQLLDIPYFTAASDSNNLTVSLSSPIINYFQAPSYNQVISKLHKLNETDLLQQIKIIQGAFYARVAQTIDNTAVANISTPKQDVDISLNRLLTTEELLHHATKIAAEIQQQTIIGSDGIANWISLSYLPNAERFQLQPLEEYLYDGKSGIALFLAALDYLNNSTQFRSLILGALQSTRTFLHTSDADSLQRFSQRIGIGAATGIASLIYCFVKINQFIPELTLLEDAQKLAKLITPEIITADQQLDIIGGTSGAILGLLSLYTATGDRQYLDIAVNCGQHLLKNRINIDNYSNWKTVAAQPLTGFSHGTAGIVYALLRLYAVTQNQDYLDAAVSGIKSENQSFSEESGNWQDLRLNNQQNSADRLPVGWCHGAPGIGLARLGCLSILDTEQIREDIEMALQTTQKYSWEGQAHLCCGEFGRIEFLLTAAQKLSRLSLAEIANQRAAAVLKNAENSGFQLLLNLPTQVYLPSFFRGTAGIGYQLLRLAYPHILPSVLLWE